MAPFADNSSFQLDNRSLFTISSKQSVQLAARFFVDLLLHCQDPVQLFHLILKVPIDPSHLVAVESLRSLLLKNGVLQKANVLSEAISHNSIVRNLTNS